MGKSIQIITTCAVVLSLMAFSLIDSYLPISNVCQAPDIAKDSAIDLFYAVGPRFEGITTKKLLEAKSAKDFFKSNSSHEIRSFHSLEIIVVEDDKRTDNRLASESEMVNEEMSNFLKSLSLSSHFIARANVILVNANTGELEKTHFTPHFTIVPEKQAIYSEGESALIEFLRIENKPHTIGLDKEKLQPAKLYFSIDPDGELSKVHLDRTSGYPQLDDHMLSLIKKLPGTWTPAENELGQKVEQEMVVTFGMVGC